MKRHLYKSWQVTFANKYARSFGMSVDHLHDEFMDVCEQMQGAFATLTKSQPMRIEVLQSYPDISGDDLTLAAKLNFDPGACSIVNNVIDTLIATLAQHCIVEPELMKVAVNDVINNDWGPMIEITKAFLADEAILKMLKAELMVTQ